MGIMAVLTNTTLMAMSPEVREFLPEMTTVNYILLFVAVEVIFSVEANLFSTQLEYKNSM